MTCPREEEAKTTVADEFRALTPAEFLSRYAEGERDFRRINLLRAELELIAAGRRAPPRASANLAERHNPLWADYRNVIDREFEWDAFGHFIPIELDELPPRDLASAVLSDARLDGSYLYPVDLRGADLRRVSLRNAILLDVDLRGADLSYADLRWATVRGNLADANLYMARLQRCSLAGCDLSGANLGRAKLRRSSLASSNLRGARLRYAHFDETILNGADLRGVDLVDVTFESVYLTGVTLDSSQQTDFLRSLRVALRSDT